MSSKKDGKAAVQSALHQYQDTNGHFSLVRCVWSHRISSDLWLTSNADNGSNFRLADLVTIMNGFCGAFSLFSTARYLLSNDKDHLWSALWFPIGGLFFDFLDGKVARWRNSASLLGQELDSLADLVRFHLSGVFRPR